MTEENPYTPCVPDLRSFKISELPAVIEGLCITQVNSIPVVEKQAVLPLDEFVVKVFERCNLACDYCYMYESADQSWRDKPVVMSCSTLEVLVGRIAEHVEKHQLKRIEFVFHGGEPLLRGRKFIDYASGLLRSSLSGVTVDLRVQTNATHLDREMLKVLTEHDVHVGVSLDGDKVANDRHRLTRAGGSSFDDVVAGLELLKEPAFCHLFRGIYCTIDVRNDPMQTYRTLLEFEPPMIDFMLPHGNWEQPPPLSRPFDNGTRYADWLISIFDVWFEAASFATRIRLFDNIIAGILGGASSTETIGIAPVQFVCIDTDGSIGQVDTLKSAFEGATETGMNIFDNSFDEAAKHPEIQRRQQGLNGLCADCRSCDVVSVCGGGYYPHRYSSGNGFENRSVYCLDLLTLINYIERKVTAAMQRFETQRQERCHAAIPNVREGYC